MNNFTYYSPTEFVFGRGVEEGIGKRAAEKGFQRALIVYGKGSVVRSGLLDRVKASLDAAGVLCTMATCGISSAERHRSPRRSPFSACLPFRRRVLRRQARA